MLVVDGFEGYQLLDAGDNERLERYGGYTVRRPEPQAWWKKAGEQSLWENADLAYVADGSSGEWQRSAHLPGAWLVRFDNLSFLAKPAGHKQVGLFPEQATNWRFVRERVMLFRRRNGRNPSLLNLFAYTGALSVAAAAAGAEVCHVDASKTYVKWAQENLLASGLANAPVRFLVDDAKAFCSREARRGRKYDAIVMDPPSFGRGPGGETWKISKDLMPLLEVCREILSEAPLFVIVSFHTTGLEPLEVAGMVAATLPSGRGVLADTIGIRCESPKKALPCGAVVRWG